MIGLSISATFGGAISEMNTADAIPSGTAIIIAPAVTRSVPNKSGKSPNMGGSDVGYQFFPVRKSKNGMSLKSAAPSPNRNKEIRIRITTVTALTASRRDSIANSLDLLLFNILSHHVLCYWNVPDFQHNFLSCRAHHKVNELFCRACWFSIRIEV